MKTSTFLDHDLMGAENHPCKLAAQNLATESGPPHSNLMQERGPNEESYTPDVRREQGRPFTLEN